MTFDDYFTFELLQVFWGAGRESSRLSDAKGLDRADARLGFSGVVIEFGFA